MPPTRPLLGSTRWIAIGLATVLVASGCADSQDDPLAPLNLSARLAELQEGASIEPEQADAWRTELLEGINAFRAEHGQWPLAESEMLTEIAGSYAEQMIEEDFFGHLHPQTGASVGTRARQAGYRYWKVGENLAGGHLSPAGVLEAWKESPSHRANLLDPEWQETGIGIRAGGELGLYFVAEFGWPMG
jgi:uncharacterized protein YkwD